MTDLCLGQKNKIEKRSPEIERASLILMMCGARSRRIRPWLLSHPEGVHELINTEDDLLTIISLASYANSEDRTFIRNHLYSSTNWYAWMMYIQEVPYEAEMVQGVFIDVVAMQWTYSRSDSISAATLKSWLGDVRGTNLVPIQHMMINLFSDYGTLVESTINNEKLSLFATVFLILRKGQSEQFLTNLMHKDKRTKEIKDIILTAIKEKYLNAQQITECVRTLMRWDRELIDEIEGLFIEQGYNIYMYAQEIRREGPIQALIDAHYIMES